jgi:hypothetical protein
VTVADASFYSSVNIKLNTYKSFLAVFHGIYVSLRPTKESFPRKTFQSRKSPDLHTQKVTSYVLTWVFSPSLTALIVTCHAVLQMEKSLGRYPLIYWPRYAAVYLMIPAFSSKCDNFDIPTMVVVTPGVFLANCRAHCASVRRSPSSGNLSFTFWDKPLTRVPYYPKDKK